MKIYSWNVNGIRSVSRKGFAKWLSKESPDIVCLQEIKANEDQFPPELNEFGYHLFVNSAEKPGYAGVAIFSKIKPKAVEEKIGLKRFDSEGRFLRLDFKNFVLINLYLPHGGRQKENLPYKLKAYKAFFKYLDKIKNKNVILIGDFNIAHDERDLARPKQNVKNIMFTPKERKQLDHLSQIGFLDTFRMFNEDNGYYTWWPYMANARARNLGWRIDYCFISKPLEAKTKDAFTHSKVLGSDHCPIGVWLSSLS